MSTSPPVETPWNTHPIVRVAQLSLQLFAEAQRQLQLTATWMGFSDGFLGPGCWDIWDSSGIKIFENGLQWSQDVTSWNAGPAGPAPSRSSATILCSTLARSVDSGHKPCCCWRSCRDLPFNRCPDARAEFGEGWILQKLEKSFKIPDQLWTFQQPQCVDSLRIRRPMHLSLVHVRGGSKLTKHLFF